METKQVQAYDNDEIEIDLKELCFLLLHRLWIIILAGVICAGIAGVWTKTMVTPMYQSTSMLYILSQSTSITSLADIQMGMQLTSDYVVLIKSRPVIEEVINNLDLKIGYNELLGMIAIDSPANTRIINITVSHEDPQKAKLIADEVAEVSAERMANIMKTEEPSIAEQGHVAENPYSPNTKKNCGIAGLLGMVAVAAIFILIYLVDDHIKTQDDIEKYLGITTLGIIPMEGDEEHASRKKKRKREKKEKKIKSKQGGQS